jgi:plastocyanin
MVLSAPAQGATKSVSLGVPTAKQKTFDNLGAEVNAFFPSSITVRVGDKVRFLPPAGLHTVQFPARGGSPAPLVSPGAPIAGATDPAGQPYWFNSQPDFELTDALLKVTFGKTLSYSGSNQIYSGLPFTKKPLTVKFTKAGTFTYYCNVHSGMKGRVTVLGRHSRAPSAKSDAKKVKAQLASALKEARSLQTALLDKNQIQLGNSGRSGVEILAMYPGTMTVPVGTVITFSISRFSLAAHTATTGPGDPLREPGSFLGRLSASVRENPPFDQAGVYSSDARGSPALLTPALHGNGFWSTGFMDRSDATPQPKNQQVKIVAPGTYNFYCLLHPFMKTVVTAT